MQIKEERKFQNFIFRVMIGRDNKEKAELLKDGQPVNIEPKTLMLLEFLTALPYEPGRVIRQDDILERLFGPVGGSLNACYQYADKLRTALGDDGNTFIKTHPKRGLEFLIPYESTAGEAGLGTPAMCRHLGSADDSMSYQIERMRDGALKTKFPLIGMRDTHIRVEARHRRYNNQTLKDFGDALGVFLQRRDAQYSLVAGQIVDKNYIQQMQKAEEAAQTAINCHRLNPAGPLMNFVILEYEGDYHEVLFGFGRLRENKAARDDEAVFLSNDKGMVAEFTTLYETLLHHSENSDLEALLTPATMVVKSAWDDRTFLDFIGRVRRGSTVKILTSVFVERSLNETLLRLLAKDVHIEIIVMNPDNQALMEARFRGWSLDDMTPEKARSRLLEQLELLPTLPTQQRHKGTLEMRVSDIMPCGFVVHGEHEALLGIMPAHASYFRGPMIVAGRNTDIWTTLADDWNARWPKATLYEQSVGQRQPMLLDHVVSDREFVEEIEARTPDGAEIWIAAPDLATVGDDKPFSEQVRNMVAGNAVRGIDYHYIYPKDRPGTGRIEVLKECFTETLGKLSLHPVPEDRFLEITLTSSTFISFRQVEATCYMQLPVSGAQKGWVRLDKSIALKVGDAMQRLMKDYPAESPH